MTIERLDAYPAGASLEADVAIVGGGACGLAIAGELAGSGLDILVLESGLLEETAEHGALNAVEVPEETWSEAERDARSRFHTTLAARWSGEEQGFGVRCRGLGGSTLAWAGKSAAFDPIDFERRPWVPHSGWPIDRATLDPYLDRAARILNLGPNRYDNTLWELIGQPAPKPAIARDAFSSFFWQFSRSRLNPLDSMRLGADFAATAAPGVRVLLNATALRLRTSGDSNRFERIEIATIDGQRASVRARICVLAASAIENARLLLASDDRHEAGLGNAHDQVGRFLIDHVMAPLGWFDAAQAKAISARFGFFGLRHDGRSHMYSHGLALSDERQRAERLLRGAVFIMEQRSRDDPFSAVARLVKRRSKAPWRDLALVASSPASLAQGVALRMLEHDRMPDSLRRAIVEQVVRRLPNRAAREYRFRGLPHKLDGAVVQGICEQAPSPENRVVLSDRTDRLGQRMARVEWRAGDAARHTLLRMGELVRESFAEAGLPVPELPDWIRDSRPEDGPLIDAGHTMGTTRMADDPREGVVDRDCRVHGVEALYVAGGSVMPTSGHANPTLMMVALSVRLADHLKQVALKPAARTVDRMPSAAPAPISATGSSPARSPRLPPNAWLFGGGRRRKDRA